MLVRVAQMVKNLPAMREARVQFPGRGWIPTPVFLPGESHGQRSLVQSTGLQKDGHD